MSTLLAYTLIANEITHIPFCCYAKKVLRTPPTMLVMTTTISIHLLLAFSDLDCLEQLKPAYSDYFL